MTMTMTMLMLMMTTLLTSTATSAAAAEAAFTVATSSPGCPAGCACKWKNGKQTVECVDTPAVAAGVTAALGIDPATQVLDISDNDLSAAGFPRDTFAAAGLSNLQRIRASRCNVYYVHDRAFRGLTNLVDLDLSANCLPDVPTAAFAECRSLMKLSLSGNPIGRVPVRAFRHLGQLVALDLSGCGLTAVQAGAFDGLPGLDWLRLDDNRLTHVPGPHTLPGRLHGVELHRNSWQCDCRMIDMHRWLTDARAPVTVEPVCSGPAAHANVSVRRVPVAELACAPVAYPAARAAQDVAEGANLSLRCLVDATPAAAVRWLFGGTPVPDGRRHNASELTAADGGNTTAELYVYNASVGDAGTYACVAENRAGRAQAEFAVTVRPGRPLSITGPVDDRSAPSQSSSAAAAGADGGGGGGAHPLLYVACLAAGSLTLSVVTAVLVAVRCKRAKRGGGSGGDGGRPTTVVVTGGKRRPAAPVADGYRTVSTTADKEPPVPMALHPSRSTAAEVTTSAASPTAAPVTTKAVTVTSKAIKAAAAVVNDDDAVVTVTTADINNPDVVSDAKRGARWEIDFEQIVWAECPPATGYVSIQIPVQCGIECLGAYYATAVAETVAVSGCNAMHGPTRRQQNRHRRAAVLAAYDDTVQVRSTVQGGYPTASGPTAATSLRAPSIIVDDDADAGCGSITPIISPPLPFRSATADDTAAADDSIAL